MMKVFNYLAFRLLLKQPLLKVVLMVTVLLLINTETEAQNTETEGQPPKARHAPFCVDTEKVDPRIRAFKRIFKFHKHRSDSLVPVSNDTEKMSSPFKYIEEIKFTRITITDPIIPNEDHPLKVLKQWLHITVTVGKIPLSGLYIQTIAGPVGVPSGQFHLDFACQDCPEKNDRVSNKTVTVSCKYRPVSAYRHPNVLVVGGDPMDSIKIKNDQPVHFHFSWIDSYTDEFAYFQFLIVAVRNFREMVFETFYTNPIDNSQMDGDAAVLSPFYRGWTKSDLKCHVEGYTDAYKKLPFDFTTIPKERTIKYNKEFDDCTVKGTPYPGTLMCPPGVLVSKVAEKTSQKWKEERKNYLTNDILKPCRDCGTVYVPIDWCEKEPTTPGCEDEEAPFDDLDDGNGNGTAGEEWEDVDVNIKKTNWLTRGVHRYHGIAFIYCFSIATSLSFFYARFMKESTPIMRGDCCLGIGSWLVAHINLTYIGLTALLIGIFLIFGADMIFMCEERNLNASKTVNATDEGSECLKNVFIHKSLGTVSILLLYLAYSTGWWRPENPRNRFMVILTHVVCGYGSKYIALLSIIPPLTSIDSQIAGLWIGAEVLCLCVFVIASIIQVVMDSKLGITPLRGYFPVLEGVDTFKNPPLGMLRSLLLGVHFFVQMLMITLIIIMY